MGPYDVKRRPTNENIKVENALATYISSFKYKAKFDLSTSSN